MSGTTSERTKSSGAKERSFHVNEETPSCFCNAELNVGKIGASKMLKSLISSVQKEIMSFVFAESSLISFHGSFCWKYLFPTELNAKIPESASLKFICS